MKTLIETGEWKVSGRDFRYCVYQDKLVTLSKQFTLEIEISLDDRIIIDDISENRLKERGEKLLHAGLLCREYFSEVKL